MITADTPAGRAFAAFGPGSLIGFPAGALFGQKWIEIGAGTMIGSHVSLSAGMVPGQELGAQPVVRIGDRCVIGRGSHIVGHYSIVIGRRCLYRAQCLHHRPKSRLRRSRCSDRTAMAEQRGSQYRPRKLARGRGDCAARRVHRPQRRGWGWLCGPWPGPRPVRCRRSTRQDGPPACGGQRVGAGADIRRSWLICRETSRESVTMEEPGSFRL